MRSGDLRQRVTVMAPGSITADSFGNPIQTPTTVGIYWAQVSPFTGLERVIAPELDQLQGNLTHKVRLRYVGPLTTLNWLLFNGRRLNIQTAINVDERSRELLLLCVESAASNTPRAQPS